MKTKKMNCLMLSDILSAVVRALASLKREDDEEDEQILYEDATVTGPAYHHLHHHHQQQQPPTPPKPRGPSNTQSVSLNLRLIS